jgi:N-acetylglutamate synthase-like GNAT family acetyltransferase
MKNIVITKADIDDIGQICSLMNNLFEMENVSINIENQKKGIKMLIENDLSDIIIAKTEHNIIGICSLQATISTAEGAYSVWLEDFIVEKKYRKYGVGSKMIMYIEKIAKEKKFKRIQLLCDENNIVGENFYKKHSFLKTNWKCWQKKV